MFEELAQGDDLAHVDDAALIDAITGWTRASATVAAHRMAAIAELTDRRIGSEQALERELWSCDGWDSAAAEVAAASGISARKASTHMHQALALRHRLPQIGKLVAEGTLSEKLATTIAWRTQLIEDPEVLARVDADLAEVAGSFGPLSEQKLENAIDAAITVHDPAAVPRFKNAAKGCDVTFGDRDDTTGTRSIWGRLTITDAELLERRVDHLVRMPCSRDPRRIGDRRAAALGVLGAGGTELPCQCGQPDCPATGRDPRADAIVINVITDRHPNTGPDDPDPGPDATPPPPGPRPLTSPPPRPPTTPPAPPPPAPSPPSPSPSSPGSSGPRTDAPPPAADTEPEPVQPQSHPRLQPHPRPTATGLAVIAGGGIVPTPLLTELVALGTPVRPVPSAADLGAEPRYRPSTKLARYVRSRDLTCCFPGCDRPAERCDIDHTTAHGIGGLTHPGNTKCACRKHHLLKTFWTGPTGWTDQQHADGTIVWTSPTGHRYTRPPGSRLLFPHWDTTTPLPEGTPTTPPEATRSSERGLRMPLRKHSRAHDRTQRLHAERQRNQRIIDENRPPF